MMKKYNFDEIIQRRGTGCVKWDETPPTVSNICPPLLQGGVGRASVIPLWVADMDFKVAPAIQEAIRRRADHGIFGYTHVGDDYYEAVISWFRRRHQWTIRRDEIIYTTGVVPAISAVIKALTLPGEKVLILSPDYNCFFSSIRNCGCEALETQLVSAAASSPQFPTTPGQSSPSGVTYSVCWPDFEAKCADEKTTVFLLCNPHNPTGRVWTPDELHRMNTICMKHGVKVISDEIHCELIMPGHRFQPFAAVNDACRHNSVILNSPSKSFNIAGLQTANIICSQPEWHRRIDRVINIHEVCDLNPFGPVALIAAYNECEDWIDSLNKYLWNNYLSLCTFFGEHLPQFKVASLEGTYLVWVDISALGMPAQQYCHRLLSEGSVWVNPGTMYGPQSGEGYIRINIACPRSLLMEGLSRIESVTNNI